MIERISTFFNPERFQGRNKKKSYFEGWYYKIIDATEQHAFAIIPAMSIDSEGNQHAFIQVLDGKKLTSAYYRFDIKSFRVASGKLHVTIDQNVFTEDHFSVNLPEIEGSIQLINTKPWPKPFYSPGIMGPYSFVPFMECYHGIVSMDHELMGSITYNGQLINFDQGRGYMEKDWGKSFPSAYFWMQCNHFSEPGISLKCSVARIPWIKRAFTGFICGLQLQNKLIRFTTYNKTKLIKSYADDEKVELVMQNKKYKIEIMAFRADATGLASPILGHMEGKIEESMNSVIEVTLTDLRTNQIVFQDKGRNGALEVAGEIETISKLAN
jgi:hypothetical protein